MLWYTTLYEERNKSIKINDSFQIQLNLKQKYKLRTKTTNHSLNLIDLCNFKQAKTKA